MQNLVMNSTNTVRLRRLQDAKTREFLRDATVTGTLKDGSNDVVGTAEDVAMAYAAGQDPDGEDGEYVASLSHALPLVENAQYVFVVTAVSADLASRREFNEPCVAVKG